MSNKIVDDDEELIVGGGIVAPDLNNYSKASSAPSAQTVDKSSSTNVRVRTSNTDEETIHIGDTVVSKHELIEAFRGVLKPDFGGMNMGMSSNNMMMNNPQHLPPARQFGNPAPVGLCGFALTCFTLSLINIRARSVEIPNVVCGLAFFYGGGAQILTGMWEIACGNTFGAVAFTSYGAYWLSYGALHTGAFGIGAAYEGHEDQFHDAIGMFEMGWFIFTSFMAICAIRTTVANFALFFCLALTYLFLACGDLTGILALTKTGGWIGLLTAFIAWYNAFKAVANKENTFLVLKDYRMPGGLKYD